MRGIPACRLSLQILVLLSAGCNRSAPPETPPVTGTSRPAPAQSAARLDPDVAFTLEQALASAEHPELKWGKIPDVAALLKPLYEAEPDRLLWFDGTAPVSALERTIAALGAAGDHGLDPDDCDAASLAEAWAALKTGVGSGADRVLLDLGVSVAVARLV